MYRYLGVFDSGDDLPGTFTVTFPDVPEAITQGNGIADSKEMATEVLELSLGLYIEDGKDLPPAKTKRAKNGQRIEPSALVQMKLALYEEFRKARIPKTELAKRMGIAKQQIDRLFDLQHSSRVEQLELAFRVIGKTLAISVQDAA